MNHSLHRLYCKQYEKYIPFNNSNHSFQFDDSKNNRTLIRFVHSLGSHNVASYNAKHSIAHVIFICLIFTYYKTQHGWCSRDSTNIMQSFCVPNRNWVRRNRTGCPLHFIKYLYFPVFYFYLRIPILRLPTSWRIWRFGQIDCNQIFSSLQTTRNHMLQYNITLLRTTTRL
jgi:hypothetical protein